MSINQVTSAAYELAAQLRYSATEACKQEDATLVWRLVSMEMQAIKLGERYQAMMAEHKDGENG